MNQSEIYFPHIAGAELLGKVFVGLVIPRDDQSSGSILVETMYDPGAQRAPGTG